MLVLQKDSMLSILRPSKYEYVALKLCINIIRRLWACGKTLGMCNKCRKNLRCQRPWLEGWGLGRCSQWFSHRERTRTLICSPVTILKKQCNKQTCLTSELPARSEDKASLIRSNTKTAEKLYNTTLSQNSSTQTKAQTSKRDKAPGKSPKQTETSRNRENR